MRAIHPADGTAPEVDDVGAAVAAEDRTPGPSGAWVFANMVTTVDGAVTVDGRSGDLGGDGDRAVFRALRGEADVIVVGAETVRTEGYHLPGAPADDVAGRRAARGQAARPRLCIVTRQGRVTGAPPLLDELPPAGAEREPWQRPIVATVGHRRGDAPLDDRVDTWELGDSSVEPTALVAALAAAGLRRVLCEGGPRLLGELAGAGLVDEWNFTIAAEVVGGDASRAIVSPAPHRGQLTLERLWVDHGSNLFARYLTRRG